MWKKLSTIRAEWKASGKQLMPPQEARGCKGKIRYTTLEMAVATIKGMSHNPKHNKQHFRRTQKQLVGYKCRFCEGFHVGHDRG